MPDREAILGAGALGHSATGTSLEGAADLGYRCAMPRALGLALCRGPAPAGLGSDEEAGSGE
eukprot:14282991-Heterocapsa_arctica.AAC.1